MAAATRRPSPATPTSYCVSACPQHPRNHTPPRLRRVSCDLRIYRLPPLAGRLSWSAGILPAYVSLRCVYFGPPASCRHTSPCGVSTLDRRHLAGIRLPAAICSPARRNINSPARTACLRNLVNLVNYFPPSACLPWSAGILPAYVSMRLSVLLLGEISILLLALRASRGMPAELDEANLVNLVNFFPPSA